MQSKIGSAIETATNIGVGYVFSVALTATVFPAIGYAISIRESLAVSVIYTIAAIGRHYGLRRFFNWYNAKGHYIVSFLLRRLGAKLRSWARSVFRVPQHCKHMLSRGERWGKRIVIQGLIGKRPNTT